jgi:hypothetical protein
MLQSAEAALVLGESLDPSDEVSATLSYQCPVRKVSLIRFTVVGNQNSKFV